MLLSFKKQLDTQKVKFIFLNNGPCLPRPTLIDSNHNELSYYPFQLLVLIDALKVVILLIMYMAVQAFQIKQDVNEILLNMTTNDSKLLVKHILCDCKCRFDGKECSIN